MITLTPYVQLEVTLVPEVGGKIELRQPDEVFALELAPFVKGDPGNAAAVSANLGNILTQGPDGGLYVPAPSLETEHW